jgi:Cation efflux family
VCRSNSTNNVRLGLTHTFLISDVLSLIVALYAIKVRYPLLPNIRLAATFVVQMTNKSEVDNRYSYGWHRAEILAALVNGVFLLALCLSIFLEAMERFFSTPGMKFRHRSIICADQLILQRSEIQSWSSSSALAAWLPISSAFSYFTVRNLPLIEQFSCFNMAHIVYRTQP